jgi:putative transposase
LKLVDNVKARGVNDILIAVVDGLKGFPEAITAVLPQTQVSMRAMDQAERECSNEDDATCKGKFV